MSAVSTGGGNQDYAYKTDGTINTGYISNWISLSNTDKKIVISERKNQGVKLWYGKGIHTGNNLDNIKELKKEKFKYKSNIKSIKKMFINDNAEGDDNYKPEDAGDQFRGKQYKKKSKKK